MDEEQPEKGGSALWVRAACGGAWARLGMVPPWVGGRLQEPASLGLPMYEAHRSWRSAGSVYLGIVTYAANNTIAFKPIFRAGSVGPSLPKQ
ncbi:hypothetical protein AH782_13050 [Salmonella enterica subsp. enterica]|nr:hypothetical protein [Salmonella enterica subsp. enterica serovar Rubislaw]